MDKYFLMQLQQTMLKRHNSGSVRFFRAYQTTFEALPMAPEGNLII